MQIVITSGTHARLWNQYQHRRHQQLSINMQIGIYLEAQGHDTSDKYAGHMQGGSRCPRTSKCRRGEMHLRFGRLEGSGLAFDIAGSRCCDSLSRDIQQYLKMRHPRLFSSCQVPTVCPNNTGALASFDPKKPTPPPKCSAHVSMLELSRLISAFVKTFNSGIRLGRRCSLTPAATWTSGSWTWAGLSRTSKHELLPPLPAPPPYLWVASTHLIL